MASPAIPSPPKVVILNYAKGPDGKDAVVPEGGNPVSVLQGQKVVFVPGDEGATNLTVTFPKRSPFREDDLVATVNGGETVAVKRAKSATKADNLYAFDCRLFINGAPVTAIGGGELEIGPGGD